MNLNEAVAKVEAPACLGWKPSWKIKESSSFVFLRQVTLAAHSLVHVNETKRKVSREANIQRMAWMPLLPSFAGKAAKKRLRTELSAGEAKAGENPVPLTMQMHKSSAAIFPPKNGALSQATLIAALASTRTANLYTRIETQRPWTGLVTAI